MAPDIQCTPALRRYAWIGILLAGMLCGAAVAYIMLDPWTGVSLKGGPAMPMAQRPEDALRQAASFVPSAPSASAVPSEPSEPSASPDTFGGKDTVLQTWRQTQRMVALRAAYAPPVSSAQNSILDMTTSRLAQLLEPMAPVQSAVAAPPQALGNSTSARTQAPTTVPSGASLASTPAAPQRGTKDGGASGARANPSADTPSFPQALQSGTLGEMAKLRAELEQLKMQVTIEETRSRLNQLRGTSAPAPVSAPSMEQRPSLDFPPIGMPAARAGGQLRILSIQSVNGNYTATVSTPSGPQVVKANDMVAGSRVVSITRNSVIISRGQGHETLAIQD